MSLHAVEWILLVRYNVSAHRAIYGRLSGGKYTKDYIQLSRSPEFTASIEAAFPKLAETGTTSLPIKYKWPGGSAEGTIFKRSADRPHLAWETSRSPRPWRMSPHPSQATIETIPGNPSHRDPSTADVEFHSLSKSGVGQPYLIAVKLREEATSLHLRVCIANPAIQFSWADLSTAPTEVQRLASATSDQSALAWQHFPNTIGSGSLYFDTEKKVSPWSFGPPANIGSPSMPSNALSSPDKIERLGTNSDFIAENLPYDSVVVHDLEESVKAGDFSVTDTTSSVKVRGSAQRVFSEMIKRNYGWKCALTGIRTRDFLVASHIVPWSADEKIRLDPSNGICLSVLVDRAFENGFLLIDDDLTVRIDWQKVGFDIALKSFLAPLDGIRLDLPTANPPNAEFLRRRRALVK